MAAKEKPSSLPRDTDFLSSLPPCSPQSPGCDPETCWAPGGSSHSHSGSRTSTLCLERPSVVVPSRDSAGLGSTGTVRPCFPEYNISSFVPQPGGLWRVALPSPEVQLSGPFLPCHPSQHPSKQLVPGGSSEESTEVLLHQTRSPKTACIN